MRLQRLDFDAKFRETVKSICVAACGNDRATNPDMVMACAMVIQQLTRAPLAPEYTAEDVEAWRKAAEQLEADGQAPE